jgi:preprotein translocase subunit SecB
MTDVTANAENNDGFQVGPQIRVLAQYVKDLSFENPGAPDTLRAGLEQPAIDLQLDVGARAMTDAGPNIYEVDLKINAKSSRNDQVVFIAELVYSGLFEFLNLPAEALEPMLLAECPRLLFPFARRILADTTREGGFPPLMLDPVDFGALYQSQGQNRENLPRA